jgi:ribosomal protein S3
LCTQQTNHEYPNVLAYADDVVIGKNGKEIRQLLVEIENIVRKLRLKINQGKTKYMIVEWGGKKVQNKVKWDN